MTCPAQCETFSALRTPVISAQNKGHAGLGERKEHHSQEAHVDNPRHPPPHPHPTVIGGSCHKFHFVATKVCLSRQNFCRDKTFIVTNDKNDICGSSTNDTPYLQAFSVLRILKPRSGTNRQHPTNLFARLTDPYSVAHHSYQVRSSKVQLSPRCVDPPERRLR